MKSIEWDAFCGCTGLSSVNIIDLTSWCNISFGNSRANPLFYAHHLYLNGEELTDLIIPDDINLIQRYSFIGCLGLNTVTISDNVTSIGACAFYGCTNLNSVNMGISVEEIEDYAFRKCDELTSVTIYSTIPPTFSFDGDIPYIVEENSYYLFVIYPEWDGSYYFSNCKNAILHVPHGLKKAYTEADVWKDFDNMVDDIAANKLMVDDLLLGRGQLHDMTINLVNNDLVDKVQFDFTLPEGLSIATDDADEYIVELCNRSSGLDVICGKMSNGKYRILLYSTNSAAIEPGEGAILRIKIAFLKETEPGNFKIPFNNIYVSWVNGDVSVNEPGVDFTANVTVSQTSTMLGDADGDYVINVTDVMVIVDYILGKTLKNFIFANSDMDNNGIVNITDAMNVVNIILGIRESQVPPMAQVKEYNLLQMGSGERGCQIHTTGAIPIAAVQMDVTLPDGCSLDAASLLGRASHTHKVMTRQLDENRYRVVVISVNKATLDTNAPILNLKIEGKGGFIGAENVICTDANSTTILSQDISTVITGMNAVYANAEDDAPIYNISGQRVSNKQKGLVITKGHKAVVR